MSTPEISALISAFVSAVTLITTWIITNRKQKAEERDSFRDDLLGRIKAQEDYITRLNERIDNLQTERQELSDKYDTKTAEIRAEMQEVIKAAAIEVAHWRESYNKLLDDYQKLKLEHHILRRDYESIKYELEHLRKAYELVNAKYEALRKLNETISTSNDPISASSE